MAEIIKKEHSEEEVLRAAYALNMCTVSVSQIVEYNDIYILEQEYEAILNNLNLEMMPKDEALLNIMTELLNTITFFRIHELKKAFIEKKYQQKVKNAIWAATPNLSILVPGDPVAMGMQIACQVGIGYMNYRREKSNISIEREEEELELQITAIEQFNALRRELFTTAWRLADEYGFPDEYRLTERQIKQYNSILMDQDDIRRYERLDSIKDKFIAYPTFWYHLGNSANRIANGNRLSDKAKDNFRKRAVDAFDLYREKNRFNILREDPIAAASLLEYADILDPASEKDTIKRLITDAQKLSGNENDILEICAMSYLRIGETNLAGNLLRILVNEDYNSTVNAQLLSRIYVGQYAINHSEDAYANYELLATRVEPRYLFPMPSSIECDSLELQEEFLVKQRENLENFYKNSIEVFVEKNISTFERLASIQDCSTERGGLEKQIIESANGMFESVERMESVLGKGDMVSLTIRVENVLKRNAETISGIQDKVEKDISTVNNGDRDGLRDIFSDMLLVFKKQLDEVGVAKIRAASSMEILTVIESNLRDFCQCEKIPEVDLHIHAGLYGENTRAKYLSVAVFGKDAAELEEIQRTNEEIIGIIKKSMSELCSNEKRAEKEVLLKGDKEFDNYFKRRNNLFVDYKKFILAIVVGNTKDILISADGVFVKQPQKGNRPDVTELIYFDDIHAFSATGLKFDSHMISDPEWNAYGLEKMFRNFV